MRRFPAPARFRLCLALITTSGLLAIDTPDAHAQEVKPVEPPPEFNPATEPAVVAVAKVLPAVVNISTERTIRRQVVDPLEQLYEQFFDEPTNRRPREMQQKVQSLGSGFLVDGEGYIVTNAHVVERAAEVKIQVTFSDGSIYPAHYIAGDPQADLALIKIDKKPAGKPFPYINLGSVSPNLLGQTVLALGNPLGYNSSVSRGILSANDRELTIENNTYKHLLQTDAAINPGNSGGPLIDLAGRLVGINSVKMSFTPQGTPTQGLGFAIPARMVASKVAEFRQAADHPQTAKRASAPDEGTPNARKLFGLNLQAAADQTAGARNNPGVVVSDVEEDSPAAEAGFKQGMIIYRIGRYNAERPALVEGVLRYVAPGPSVDFVVGMGTLSPRRGLTRQSQGQLGTVTMVARE